MSYNRPVRKDLGDISGRYAILVGRWNSEVVENLKTAAVKTLQQYEIHGADVDIHYVPGAFEMPLAAQQVAASGKFKGIICLGAVIRGDTPHFDFVAGECSRGLSRVALDHQIPVGFGVLTVDNMQQAVERSGDDEANKGAEATLAVLEMVGLLRRL